jgi:hypothetical protein
MKYLYKYPQREYPYDRLVKEGSSRGHDQAEFELIDTGIFDENRYFDVFVEYAKATPEEILIKITVHNRGPESAELHLLPTLWFRNTWAWGIDDRRPRARKDDPIGNTSVIRARHEYYDLRWLICDGAPPLLFTENETNYSRIYNCENASQYVKDGINNYVVNGETDAVNPDQIGTKASAYYRLAVEPGESTTVKMRLTDKPGKEPFGSEFDKTFEKRLDEANEFYGCLSPPDTSEDARDVQRQAFAGMLWNKQFYHYYIRRWLKGDPSMPTPPRQRLRGRNHDWIHLYNEDVISMPDKWEFPWYASWDLAFHCVNLSVIDPDLAKEQLILFLREWYMHPNGQLPAYEWALSDVNPPVHAWAAWRVYKIEQKHHGRTDRKFLVRVFHKLLLNFTWWVNRKDASGNNIFEGGFLGLDNIGVFDRSATLPTGGYLEQSDGTSWMGMYCLNMMTIAFELARDDSAYEDVASKFFEHFIYIARAMSDHGEEGLDLWDEMDGFYYDVLHLPGGHRFPLKVRSMVGLIPLFAVDTITSKLLDRMPGFKRRLQWFVDNRPDVSDHITIKSEDDEIRRLLTLVNPDRLKRVLKVMLDEEEFFSPYGIRALSRFHKDVPYILHIDDVDHVVRYEPGESRTGLFGGNSNWRGPVWFPMNFLIIEALQKYYYYFGDSLKVECPTGSGQMMSLWEVATEIARRLQRIFVRDENGRRAVFGEQEKFQTDPYWRDLILFNEYFHGDNGKGLGASHQTGWTGLVAKLIHQVGS